MQARHSFLRPAVTALIWLGFLLATHPAAGFAQPQPGSVVYPLDAVGRVLDPGQELPCADHELVQYRSPLLRYSRPARVHPAFASKLSGLESLVTEVAVAVYGRAPRTLVHLGTHNCRRIRRYPDLLSEHALGNAIDLAGFDFGPARRDQPLPQGLSPALRRGFSVRMESHWTATRGTAAVHARFLRALAQRLIDRTDLFSVVLGPSWPGHHNHLHLDRAPYHMAEVF
jgi:hypothetical protein